MLKPAYAQNPQIEGFIKECDARRLVLSLFYPLTLTFTLSCSCYTHALMYMYLFYSGFLLGILLCLWRCACGNLFFVQSVYWIIDTYYLIACIFFSVLFLLEFLSLLVLCMSCLLFIAIFVHSLSPIFILSLNLTHFLVLTPSLIH